MVADPTTARSLVRRTRQHVIAKEHLFFAVCQPGFERTARDELASFGIVPEARQIEGGIEFSGRLERCYAANICSRTVTRILMRLAHFRAERFDRLSRKVHEFPWELYIAPGARISWKVSSSHSRLYHTGRIAEECAKALRARLADRGIAVSPGRDAIEPKQAVHVRLDSDVVHLSIDTTGDFLYKRGQKEQVTTAPLRETLAACVLMAAGVGAYDLVLDPMCGSGTFSLEAAGILGGQLPGLDRDFAFMRWPSFKEGAYRNLRKRLAEDHPRRPVTGRIAASDRDPRAVEATRGNLERAGIADDIELSRRDFFEDPITAPPGKRLLVVLNPPYGARLNRHDTEALYRRIGRTIRTHYPHAGYAVLSPGVEHERCMSLPYDRKILFMNGGIKVGLIVKD